MSTNYVVGISVPIHRRLRVFAKQRGYPMQQLVSQAVEALMDGRIDLEPVEDSHELTARTKWAKRDRVHDVLAKRIKARAALNVAAKVARRTP